MSDDFDKIMNSSLSDFNSCRATTSGNSHGYGYGYSPCIQAVTGALVSLCQNHPREMTMPIVQSCISRLRKESSTDVNKLAAVMNLLQKLRSLNSFEDIVRWFHGVVQDFVAIIENVDTISVS